MITIDELEKKHNIKLTINASHAIGSNEIVGLVLALASALGVSFDIKVEKNDTESTGNLLDNDA